MIAQLTPADLPDAEADLSDILHACVLAGASVGFIQPFTPAAARSYWRDRVFPCVAEGQHEIMVNRSNGVITGTVQLITAQMPNQPHRADVAKLLVHPNQRRHGTGRALMMALEDRARALGLNLLVLDTRSGDPSQRLYESLGFQIAGEIPGFCLSPTEPRYEPTTYLYKALA